MKTLKIVLFLFVLFSYLCLNIYQAKAEKYIENVTYTIKKGNKTYTRTVTIVTVKESEFMKRREERRERKKIRKINYELEKKLENQ